MLQSKRKDNTNLLKSPRKPSKNSILMLIFPFNTFIGFSSIQEPVSIDNIIPNNKSICC